MVKLVIDSLVGGRWVSSTLEVSSASIDAVFRSLGPVVSSMAKPTLRQALQAGFGVDSKPLELVDPKTKSVVTRIHVTSVSF